MIISSLSEIIVKEIQKKGPISFRDFMEIALYYPELGYYTSSKNKIGKNGDFYTSTNLSSAFGELLAKQLEEMWHILGEREFTIVEIGGGTGLLSMDVVKYLNGNKELSIKLEYFIVEKSQKLREEQKRLLGGSVKWRDSIQELSGLEGCIFSNEVVDAFPVHQVVMDEELMEIYVDYDNGFVEILKPAGDVLKDYFSELGVVLPRGYRTEINLDTLKYIERIALSLKRGFVITIDYGYPSYELYKDYRERGTLMCYYKHTANENPYEHIGEQDITSHVNFSALAHWGRKNELEKCGFTDQVHFLMGVGIEEYLQEMQLKEPKDYLRKALPIKTLMMKMGENFKILIQEKAVRCKELSGLKFESRWKL
jgi:SAM-dependent MidA family methyltransferase